MRGKAWSSKDVARALGFRPQFDSAYGTRNRTVHAGYVPNLDDAYELPIFLRTVATALSKIDRSWLKQQRKRKQDDNTKRSTKLNDG
jgi:hypothetical protein